MKNILMNVEMTKAILDGRKSQFRELLPRRFQKDKDDISGESRMGAFEHQVRLFGAESFLQTFSKYQIGETIFIAEEILVDAYLDVWYTADDSYVEAFIDDGKNPYPKLDESKYDDEYVGIIKAEDMPEECARIFLKITNIRVEKFYERTLEDIIAEGCPKEILEMDDNPYQDEWFENQYPKINPQYYVFVYEFERVENE